MWLDQKWFVAQLNKQTEQIRRYIMTSAQSVIDAVTSELTDLEGPLSVVLTEVNALVAAGQASTVDTTALQTAANAVRDGFNAIATAAAPPETPAP